MAINLKSYKRHQKMIEDDKKSNDNIAQTSRQKPVASLLKYLIYDEDEGRKWEIPTSCEQLKRLGLHTPNRPINLHSRGMLTSTNQWWDNSHANWGRRWNPRGKHRRLILVVDIAWVLLLTKPEFGRSRPASRRQKYFPAVSYDSESYPLCSSMKLLLLARQPLLLHVNTRAGFFLIFPTFSFHPPICDTSQALSIRWEI